MLIITGTLQPNPLMEKPIARKRDWRRCHKHSIAVRWSVLKRVSRVVGGIIFVWFCCSAVSLSFPTSNFTWFSLKFVLVLFDSQCAPPPLFRQFCISFCLLFFGSVSFAYGSFHDAVLSLGYIFWYPYGTFLPSFALF